jgi:hypothetical protein
MRRSITLLLVGAMCAVALVPMARGQTPGQAVDLSLIGTEAPRKVLAYRRLAPCDEEHPAEDCNFVSPDGVVYIVFAGWVCAIRIEKASASKTLVLPYGLKFGDAKAEAAAKLPKEKVRYGGWYERNGREGYDTGGGFFGEPDSLMGLILWFDSAGRLNEVAAHATCV